MYYERCGTSVSNVLTQGINQLLCIMLFSVHPYQNISLCNDNLPLYLTLLLLISVHNSKSFISFAFIVTFLVFSLVLYSHFQLHFDQDLYSTCLFLHSFD